MRQNSPKWKEHILNSMTDGKRDFYWLRFQTFDFSRLWVLFCSKVASLFSSAFLLPCFPACLNVIQDSFSFTLTLFSIPTGIYSLHPLQSSPSSACCRTLLAPAANSNISGITCLHRLPPAFAMWWLALAGHCVWQLIFLSFISKTKKISPQEKATWATLLPPQGKVRLLQQPMAHLPMREKKQTQKLISHETKNYCFRKFSI